MFGKKKCPVCAKKYPNDTTFHVLRLNTADGTHEIEICNDCADFFDKSAEVLAHRGKDNKSDDEPV